jgi:hypothetical protein
MIIVVSPGGLMGESFLLLFFKKEALAFHPLFIGSAQHRGP